MSLLPMSDSLGRDLVVLDNKLAIALFAFVLGYFGTLVEPALRILALEVEEISVGAIPYNVLVHAVAFGFGLGMAMGILKILNNIPIRTIITPILDPIPGLDSARTGTVRRHRHGLCQRHYRAG